MSKHGQNPGHTDIHGTEGITEPRVEEAGDGQEQENPQEFPAEGSEKDQTEVRGESPVPGAEPAESDIRSEDILSGEQKIAGLEAKLADLNDQYLRKAADFENFRKRMNREKQEITEFANQSLLLDLLPVIDDFERAIKSAENSKDFASFYEGITMIEKRLSTELENKWGLKRFDSAGEPFDPNRHEALQMEKKPGISEAVVEVDFVKGYFLRDRVLRFAKVKVLMPEE